MWIFEMVPRWWLCGRFPIDYRFGPIDSPAPPAIAAPDLFLKRSCSSTSALAGIMPTFRGQIKLTSMHFVLPSAPHGHFFAANRKFFPGCPWHATPYGTMSYSYTPPRGPVDPGILDYGA